MSAERQGIDLPLAADVGAVLAMGAQRFEETSAWPVSTDQFDQIVILAYEVFDHVLRISGPREQAAIHADLRFVYLVIQTAHAAVVEAACRRNGQSVQIRGDAGPYYRPDWRKTAGEIESILDSHRSRFRGLRYLRRRLRYNSHHRTWQRAAAMFRAAEGWSIGSLGETHRMWMQRSGAIYDFPTYTDFSAWFDLKSARASKPHIAVREAMKDAVADLAAGLRQKFGAVIAADEIADAWWHRVCVLSGLFDQACAWNHTPKVVLAGGLAHPLIRIVCHAVRECGGHVVGMQHSHGPAFSAKRDRWDIEFSVVDEFYSRTPGVADSLRRLASRHAPNVSDMPSFTTANSRDYETARKASQPLAGRKINTVMLVGFPAQAMRYTYARGDFSPPKLQLEMTVAAILRQQGLRILYQPHPRTAAEMSVLMAGHVDEVCTGRFEENHTRADCIVFTHPFTTTFGTVLAGMRPIVLVDLVGRDWNPPVAELLRQRLGFAEFTLDEVGRAHVSPRSIAAALDDAVAKASSEAFYSAYCVA